MRVIDSQLMARATVNGVTLTQDVIVGAACVTLVTKETARDASVR